MKQVAGGCSATRGIAARFTRFANRTLLGWIATDQLLKVGYVDELICLTALEGAKYNPIYDPKLFTQNKTEAAHQKASQRL